MSRDMQDILKRSMDEVEEPKPAPVGTYTLKALSAKLRPNTGEGDSDFFAQFVYVPTAAHDDVDGAELDGLDLESVRIFHRIWLADARDDWKLKQHLAKHGVEVSGRDLDESLKAIKGYEITAYIEQAMVEGFDTPVNNASGFAAVE